MENAIFKNWWLLTLKGAILFILGLLAFFLPEATILTLTAWFGALILLGGILSLITLIIFRKQIGKIWRNAMIFEGIIDISFGVLVLLFPKITVVMFTIIIAIWLFFVGVFQIANAFRVRQSVKNWWLFLLNGIVTAGLGVLIWFNPFEGTIALTYLIGTAAIFFGTMLIATSLTLRRLRSLNKQVST